MNKLGNRLQKLEAMIVQPNKVVLIIQHKADESSSVALSRAGLTQEVLREATMIIRVVGV